MSSSGPAVTDSPQYEGAVLYCIESSLTQNLFVHCPISWPNLGVLKGLAALVNHWTNGVQGYPQLSVTAVTVLLFQQQGNK